MYIYTHKYVIPFISDSTVIAGRQFIVCQEKQLLAFIVDTVDLTGQIMLGKIIVSLDLLFSDIVPGLKHVPL